MASNNTNENIIGLDDDTSEVRTLICRSQDGKEYPINEDVAKMSELLKTLIEEDPNETILPVPNVKGEVIIYIRSYY